MSSVQATPITVNKNKYDSIYCGNNKLKNLDNKNFRLQCFKKGMGVGLKMPLTEADFEEYIPIVKSEPVYCGNSNQIPEKYSRYGTNIECLKKGIGIGKMLKKKGQNISTTRPSSPQSPDLKFIDSRSMLSTETTIVYIILVLFALYVYHLVKNRNK